MQAYFSDEHANLIDESATRAWLEAYRIAWADRDPDAARQLFAPDASYQEHRSSPILRGVEAIREHWGTVLERRQGDIVIAYTIVALRGHTACVHWHAAFAATASQPAGEVDGLARISFSVDRGPDGLPVAYALDEWIDGRDGYVGEINETASRRSPMAP